MFLPLENIYKLVIRINTGTVETILLNKWLNRTVVVILLILYGFIKIAKLKYSGNSYSVSKENTGFLGEIKYVI